MDFPSPSSFSPSASFRMICSGVCLRFLTVLSSFPKIWGLDSHSGWISSRGPGHDGVPRNCQVAVSSVSMMRSPKDRGNLVHGYQEMRERLAPTSMIWYGAIPTELPPSAADKVEIIQVRSRAAEAFAKAEF